jgi:hypothetical protein
MLTIIFFPQKMWSALERNELNFEKYYVLACEDAYGESLFPEQMICAGEEGKDSCQVNLFWIPIRWIILSSEQT